MPSSGRKHRHLQQQHRLEHFDGEKRKGTLSPTPLPESPQSPAVSPHPYHPNHKPARLDPEHRATSGSSQVSDMTMDDFGAHESTLEYSDTSDENREEASAYFLHPGSHLLGGERGSSGESSFRDLKSHGSKSSRIVRFASNRSANKTSLAFSADDEFDDEENDERPIHRSQATLPSTDPRSRQPKKKNWVTNLAYSFRSPAQGDHRKRAETNARTHRPQQSSSTMEYPHSSHIPWREQHLFSSDGSRSSISDRWERSPLLQAGQRQGAGVYGGDYSAVGRPPVDHPLKGAKIKTDGGGDREQQDQILKPNPLKRGTAATISAYFLMDYEAGRPPTLTSNFDQITPSQLKVYRIHFSWIWRNLGINLAILVLFMAHTQNRTSTALMHTYSILLLFMDIWMVQELYEHGDHMHGNHADRFLVRPLILFLVVLWLESWFWLLSLSSDDPDIFTPFMASAVFKPVVFFYVSQKARHALEALIRIGRIVTRVLVLEMFLILTFAAIACRAFRGFDSFENLSTAWVSLFELSTTVVNPSLWMPMYEASRSNAFFFVFFIITSVFYLHSLVLSVVFQTYIQAATDIHERSATDREDAIRLAFLALLKDDESEYVSSASVRKTLQIMRPHYSAMKIKALTDIVDPSSQHIVDYPTFRTKIRQALNASIRTARSTSSFAMLVELIAVVVAVVNFVYVILLSSDFSAAWFDVIEVTAGSAITLLGLFELVIRFNPLRIPNFAPITRLNATFDGLALVGALVSCVGIVQYVAGYKSATDYLLMGRAIDMIRIMRFFQIFRDVVRRSSDVLPAMAGPVILVLTVLHVFVYLGIALWGGAINVDALAQNANIAPLYYLNNFNSYTKGLVTMFNVLVVNDWHAIAQVFLYADRCSSPWFVYPFFICGICFGVFIMLNVITAFFVESFVTKLGDNNSDSGDENGLTANDGDKISIRTGENTNVKRISSRTSLRELSEPAGQEPDFHADSNSVSSSNSGAFFSFDVYEREGFDQIMRTVAGASDQEQEAFARSICNYLEIFESLAAGREKVGYMVCCQQTLNRFGNRRFQNNAKEYITESALHKLVSDMHSELLVLTTRKNFDNRCLVRTFAHKTDPLLYKLEITASLLRQQPAVSLLVSRIKLATQKS